MTEPLTPAAGTRIMPGAQRLADFLIDRMLVEPTARDARSRGDHETAEKWEMQLRADGSARVGV